jgi:acetyl-CoA acetyltransferase
VAFYADVDVRPSEEEDGAYYYTMQEDEYMLQDGVQEHVVCMYASDNYDQAMKAPDQNHFMEAVIKEVNDHIISNHWVLMTISKVAKGEKLLE